MQAGREQECQLLADAIPENVHALCKQLAAEGHHAWAVGGSVRDVLRGVPAQDWDLATDARPEQVTNIFRRVVPTGIKHGTVTVLIGNDSFEVTTLRGEIGHHDGRRPDRVAFLDDIEDDLARRDFTINAIAFDPLERRIIDPFGGRDDLAARRLRAVGVARERFAEDGLRVLRAARFAATLECDIEPETRAAMASSAARETLAKVSVERVRDEWLKAMLAARPSIAFDVMRAAGLLDVCCTPLAELSDAAWRDTMQLIDACPADPVLRLAGLLHRVSQPGAVATRVKLSKEQRLRVVLSLAPQPIQYQPSWSDADVRRFLQAITAARKDDVLTLARAMSAATNRSATAGMRELERRIDEQIAAGAALTTRDLAVDGGTLIKRLGLAPGPEIGVLLRTLLARVTEDPSLNERDGLLAEARRIASEADLC
jgi:tRNA nucleotidyltransferase (CCA-adding enzyme)